MNREAIEKIFTVNLGVKPEERVLIFTDTPQAGSTDEEQLKGKDLKDIALAAAEIGGNICRVRLIDYPSTGQHGTEPPLSVWRSAFGDEAVEDIVAIGLMDKVLDKDICADDIEKIVSILNSYVAEAADCVIALSHYSTSHTNFRKWITAIGEARYASMPLFEIDMLDGSMSADWKDIKERTAHLARSMRGTDKAKLSTPIGTDITFSIMGVKVLTDNGIITQKGSFSNLPAGEAFLAPVEGTAEGKLVLEWAPTRKLDSPVTLIVSKGQVTDIQGDEPFAETLREAIKAEPLAANIAELGVGTNDKAKRPDNILESEKIFGTVHIAIGDNSTFGGTVRVPYHQDFIFFNPTLVVTKGKEWFLLIEEGFPTF